jgi:tetratricopeptide (TPR) repeat protein
VIKERKLPPEYAQAARLMHQKNFAEASALLEKAIKDGAELREVYRLLVSACLLEKNLTRGEEIITIIKGRYPLTADDYCQDGYILSQKELHEEAMLSYGEALVIAPQHIYALNNFGYSLMLVGRAEDAIPYFDKAIRVAPQFVYPYNNRGWAKMKIEQWEGGLEDVNYSLKLDPNNSEAYRNLGIYQMEKRDFDGARANFEKARQLDPSTLLLDELQTELDHLQQAENLACKPGI